MKTIPDNDFKTQLIKLRKKEETLIIEKLIEDWKKSKTCLSFDEWILL